MSEGALDKAVVEAKRAFLGANACGDTGAAPTQGKKVIEMAGVLIIVAAGMVVGLLANFFYFQGIRAASKFKKNTESPAEPAANGESATVEVTLDNFPKIRDGPQPRILVRYVEVDAADSNPKVGSDGNTYERGEV